MRQGQQNNQMSTQLRRQAEQSTQASRNEIVAQAQTLDSQGQPSQFFYNSTIQQATAVTKALKARFTYVPLTASANQQATNEQNIDLAQAPHAAAEELKNGHTAETETQWKLETNLITFSSNVLKVYSLPSADSPSIDLRLSTQFNGRILDIIKVPTEPFLRDEYLAQQMQHQQTSNASMTEQSKKRRGGEPSARDLRQRKRKHRDVEEQINMQIDTTENKPVPADQQHQRPAELDNQESAPDYLFVILSNFTVALICYSKKENRIEVVSRGNISEKILHDQKEPPYPVFLGQTGTFIVLMLYHNILKVIPLVREQENSNHIISLTHATAVRVRHSNVMQVIPLYQEGNPLQPTFGIVYQRTDHIRIPGSTGPPAISIKIELEKQLYDIDRRDLTPHAQDRGKLEFASNTVYRVEPLSFGGFLAFDIDSVAYYRKEQRVTGGAYHEQLKSAHTVSAFCQVDEFDVEKGKTSSGSPFVRYLFATEAGELFMLALNADILNDVLTGDGALDTTDQLINIEFLASKLTFCSSLVYLDDSLIFYSSKEGDSFILKICAEHQGDQDQPYVSVEQRFTSLAPIMDLQLARPENTQGQQSELVVVGGWNHQTSMNMVKQGVGLRSVKSFEAFLPSDMVQEFHTCGDKVYMRMYGYDQLIGMRIIQQSDVESGVIAVEGFDVTRNFIIKPSEQILSLAEVTLVQKQKENQHNQDDDQDIMIVDDDNQQKEEVKQQKPPGEDERSNSLDVVVYVTDSSIKVLSQSGEKVYCELSQQQPSLEGQQKNNSSSYTIARLSKDKLLVAKKGGAVKLLQLVLSADETKDKVSLIELGSIEMRAEVSAISISDDIEGLSVAYVALYDAPHYSLNLINLSTSPSLGKVGSIEELRILARMPLASVLQTVQTKKYYQHQLVKGGHVFSQFNHNSNQQTTTSAAIITSPSKTATILQDLPGSNPDSKMEVDMIADQANNLMTLPPLSISQQAEIAIQFSCAAALSIEHLTIKSQETDQVIMGFANGKIMQICIDLAHIAGILNESLPEFLDFQVYVEQRLNIEENKNNGSDEVGKGHEDLNIENSGPFWGAQVSYVGTIHPKMRKIKTDKNNEAVISCCDRPVVFYEVDESIEMHYLAYKQIRDIAYVTASSQDRNGDERPFLLYEDNQGIIHLSENDNLRRLQVQRMVFKMQISKTLLIPQNDSIVVLLEQPNMDYIDSSKQACNIVGLVSRSTMRTQAIFRLKKAEIAECAYSVDLNRSQNSSHQRKANSRKYILIGTAFLNPEETIPSMGRLLMLDAVTMDLIQEFPVNGSLQSILVTDYNRYLLLGVNNQIQAYDFSTFMPSLRSNTGTIAKPGKLDLLCQKSSGTFIQSIVKLASPDSSATPEGIAESIVVGDIAGRGISTFELKECRQTKVKIVESASTHISLWVNSIVALSDSQFIVFDQEGNLFIFQKNLYPTCIEEKLKLTLKGSFCIGEEVHSAAFGSFKSQTIIQQDAIQRGDDQDMMDESPEKMVKQKKKQYVDVAKSGKVIQAVVVAEQENVQLGAAGAIEEDEKDEQVMIVTRGSVAKQQQLLKSSEHIQALELSEPAHFGKILKDLDFAKRFAAKTLEEMFLMQTQTCSIIYGTNDGSIGSLFQIPPKVYLLLQLLQHELDQHVNLDLVQQKRSEYRSVKQTPATSTELQAGKSILNGIIDGDLTELFLDLPKNKKLEYTKGMLGHSGKGDEEFTELLTQIISLMKKTH